MWRISWSTASSGPSTASWPPEQEGVALYTAAALYGARALMLLSIVVNMYRPDESVSDAVKESGLDSIIQLALDTALD